MAAVLKSDNQSIEELIASHEQGYALARRFYTDPAIYEVELERIFRRHWVLVGHVSEIPQPGDFKTISIANESAIIVRSDDGSINAFANVCRHRGSLVCLEQNGNTRKFTCPYHGWMYNTDGDLIAARNMPAGFDAGAYGLNKVSIDVVHGLMLVCFSDSPPTLDDCKSEMAEPMAMFGFDDLKVAAFKSYDISANWKLSIENYQECYHCATAHPDYARMHTLILDRKKRDRVQKHMHEKMNSCGIRDIRIGYNDVPHVPGEMGYSYGRTALFEGYKTGSEDGEAVAPLLGNLKEYDGGASDLEFGPFSYLLAYSDHVVAYVFSSLDVDHSKCDVYWMVRDDAEEGRDYDVEALTWLWDVTTQADKTIIANNAKGVSSSYYRPGPLSVMEIPQRLYLDWYLKELARP